MPIIAVMNRKGGSGKSTLATQIAAWYASNETSVMLGDSDPRRSASSWLSRRNRSAAPIATWPNDAGRIYRTHSGAPNVVVDTAGGLRGLDLAKQLASVDAIVVPVGPSVFDTVISIEFLREIRQHPRIINGRCQVAVIGMRWPLDALQTWQRHATPRPLPLLTVIAEAPIYRLCLESGSSIFEDRAQAHRSDLLQWQPLLDWLDNLPQAGQARAPVVPVLPPKTTESSPWFHSAGMFSHPGASQRHVEKRQAQSPESFADTMPPDSLC